MLAFPITLVGQIVGAGRRRRRYAAARPRRQPARSARWSRGVRRAVHLGGTSLQYLDQRMRKEAYDVELMRRRGSPRREPALQPSAATRRSTRAGRGPVAAAPRAAAPGVPRAQPLERLLDWLDRLLERRLDAASRRAAAVDVRRDGRVPAARWSALGLAALAGPPYRPGRRRPRRGAHRRGGHRRRAAGARPRRRSPRAATRTRSSTGSGRWPSARSSAAGSTTARAPPPTRSPSRLARRTRDQRAAGRRQRRALRRGPVRRPAGHAATRRPSVLGARRRPGGPAVSAPAAAPAPGRAGRPRRPAR